MIVFPNCKINLGLHITRKREDGYHDLETIFYPLNLTDIVEFIPSKSFSFQTTGIDIDRNSGQNLCVKAYELLKAVFPELPPVSMHLHKQIPMGAGLGGGSADGSFALKALNDHFQLGLSDEKLIELSLQLGSDCPFFIVNKPCYATGRGEILEPVLVNLAGYHILLVKPEISISTASAFSDIKPNVHPYSLRECIEEPVESWKERMVNDFEKTIFNRFPLISAIKSELYANGAVYASMTGSGSSCYGLFREKPDLRFPGQCRVFHVLAK
jgi:4-diphosphocytidyl-2-C-methyl-D-erythritol kinase